MNFKSKEEENSLLGSAYYNIGLQDENLGNFEDAKKMYDVAKELIENNSMATKEVKNEIIISLKRIQSLMPKPLCKKTTMLNPQLKKLSKKPEANTCLMKGKIKSKNNKKFKLLFLKV